MPLQPLGAGAVIPTCVLLRSSKSGFPLSGAQPASTILPSELQIGEGSLWLQLQATQPAGG